MKKAAITAAPEPLSQRKKALILGMSRSFLYVSPSKGMAVDSASTEIDRIYTQTPTYGYRKITAALRQSGYIINKKKVQRIMKAQGLRGITPKPNLSRRKKEEHVYPF